MSKAGRIGRWCLDGHVPVCVCMQSSRYAYTRACWDAFISKFIIGICTFSCQLIKWNDSTELNWTERRRERECMDLVCLGGSSNGAGTLSPGSVIMHFVRILLSFGSLLSMGTSSSSSSSLPVVGAHKTHNWKMKNEFNWWLTLTFIRLCWQMGYRVVAPVWMWTHWDSVYKRNMDALKSLQNSHEDEPIINS